MALSKGSLALVALFVCGTAANVWYRNRDRLRDPLSASMLPIGTDLSDVRFAAPPGDTTTSTRAAGEQTCHLVVLYLSTCAHCHAAAARAAALSAENRLPTTWVPVNPDSTISDFATRLPQGSVVRLVENAKSVFNVSAVPAAFLVGADNKVKAAFGYSGKEDRAFLESECR